MIRALLFSVATASAWTPVAIHRGVTRRAVDVRMFEPEPEKTDELVITSITRGSKPTSREGCIVVTDGSDSFYESRTVFQSLFDFGNYLSIVAASSSTADAKKSLISRNARYSGLLDHLVFHEGEASGAFDGADSWLAINPDESTLPAQLDAAKAAGVSRIFILLPAESADATAVEAKLGGCGVEYTVMRTGPLVAGPGGTGLKLGELETAVCEDVPREDVFRFITEALTIPEASGRAFSLCPAPGLSSTLKEMRLCGYERREEIEFLLQGVVREQEAAAEPTAEEAAEAQDLVLRSEAEVNAEREDELKMLLERARQRGIETQKKLEFEAAEKLAFRKEQEKYYSKPDDDDSTPDDDAPVETPDTPPKA